LRRYHWVDLGLTITAANVSDSKGACLAIAEAKDNSSRLVHLWADSAYRGFVDFAWAVFACLVVIVAWKKKPKGFKVQPRRWVVERTFGWLTRWRRLNRNYEHTLESSRAVVQIAMIGIMLRRLTKSHQ
jgi:putative transposase